MSINEDQNEFPLEGESSENRQSARHLPKYFRTDKNKKFLQSTLDQMLQPGVTEKINSFVGRKTAKAFKTDDNYIGDISVDRENYQLEPVSIIKDNLENIKYYADYRDYFNQIKNLGGEASNHSVNNQQEYYSWDPHIDWDKFTNFREYYWLPNGPETVPVFGEEKEIASTYTVELQQALGDYAYIFNPDGLTPNPRLKLYRGVKYRFEISTPGLPLSFRTARTLDDQFLIKDIANQHVENGVIEFELGPETPSEIFYVASNNIDAGGIITVANRDEASFIDVESEIIGKKYYTTSSGWDFTNGLKIRFIGDVKPSIYENTEWYIEGVGDKIKLVSETDVEVSFPVGIDKTIEFDSEEGFDRNPFASATGYPRDKDYITINRASSDGNFWSRYNRWFHIDVIKKSSEINKTELSIDQSARANRPIIEFEAGLKLYNFGTVKKEVVDLIDTFTSDVFSTIEGSLGYNIDGVNLTSGQRILFLNDNDPLVKGRIFEVDFINFKGSGVEGQITLKETSDSLPIIGENVLVVNGETYGGTLWYFSESDWKLAQTKIGVNQTPVFDVYDDSDISYADIVTYPSNNFKGTKIFSFATGTGANDPVLGFPLKYKSIENLGDIVFDFNYNTDVSTYQTITNEFTKNINEGYLRKYDGNHYELVSIYTKANLLSKQGVILQYLNDGTRNNYPINCFDNSSLLDDLSVVVYVDAVLQNKDIDYNIIKTVNNQLSVEFITDIDENANIVLKCFSSSKKNQNGYYEMPHNLERNPLNNDIQSFTLGEVNDHVSSIVENTNEFSGIFPGPNNLRDISNLSKNGTKFVKHSMPLNLSMYSLIDKNTNLVKSIRYSKKEYSKFKRQFLEIAETLGFEGPIKEHVDKILQEVNKDKTITMPFAFSDMLPYGAAITSNIVVEDVDVEFFNLKTDFNLNTLSNKAVTIYQNGVQLVHEKDYTFNDEGFVRITTDKQFNDVIQINEYENTNGSYIPPTPTKLGLYPSWEPTIYQDTSYSNSPFLIKGHDGSLTLSFGDFRDDLILELEKRIYNNIKIKYDHKLFCIHDYIPGLNRKTGFSRKDVYKPLSVDFVQWLAIVDEDYSQHKFYNSKDTFTYNYSSMVDKNNDPLPGWWRGIYNYYFDTETPNTTPWEMLGFTVKPTWWEEQYGPGPYTRNNLLMWEDLEKGIIRPTGEPFRIDLKYSRPGLLNYIPVDTNGNLLGPSDCNLANPFVTSNLNSNFVFGDNSPVEAAWRHSSEYPFAILASFAINSPSNLLSTGLDRSRQVRNSLDHIVYSTTNSYFKIQDLIAPTASNRKNKIYTSGVINYISEYITNNISTNLDDYVKNVKSITNNLSYKLGGFTDKSKFKLILDSRTPLNNGNVFIPEENYKIVLNSSSPTQILNYSGIIVEKQANGFVVRGYDKENPNFTYYNVLQSNRNYTVNVGGISEPYLNYTSDQRYSKDTVLLIQSDYYRVKETFVSTTFSDDIENLAKLPNVPTEGGVNAQFSNKFDKTETLLLPYGSILPTIQSVVDFILGYAEYLKDIGFVFDSYNSDDEIIINWNTSAKEFMFWSLQNWESGALISLSPGASYLKISTEYSTLDDIFDNFYDYSILKADGRKLDKEDVSINRLDKSSIVITTKNNVGIYAIKLPLIQKEHVVLIDNQSVFGDVIYEPATGYRQDRIKVFGYRSTDWDGGFNIPGFFYSQANVTEWNQWQDYFLGDVVKFKEFYYVANNKIPGTATFEDSNWTRLTSPPESGLLSNFEYKTNQFADFYDLDTDNFDVEQQKLAQHLIGYQKRQYLENIINDDVSQYKFYQGMIQEKGTRNSLDKLFDVLSSADKESLDFYEEWAIKSGQYGASESFEELEFILDENKYKSEPQAFLLTNSDELIDSSIYTIKDHEVYRKPLDYTNTVFPLTRDTSYLRSSGYVNLEDVKYSFGTYDEFTNIDIDNINKDDYVWAGSKNNDWNIFKYDISSTRATALKTSTVDLDIGEKAAIIEVTLNDTANDILVGDVIGINNVIVPETLIDDSSYPINKQTQYQAVKGFWKVVGKEINKIYLEAEDPIELVNECDATISKFVSVRSNDYVGANKILQNSLSDKSVVWIDNNDDWKVIQNNKPYSLLESVENVELAVSDDLDAKKSEFGYSLAFDNSNRNLLISNPAAGVDGRVYLYSRGLENQGPLYSQVFEPSRFTASVDKRFGEGLNMTRDGNYMIIGSPGASNVKSRFLGDYDTASNYQNGDIVQYSDQLWETVVDIQGAIDSREFGSFGSTIEVLQKNDILAYEEEFNNLLMANYPFTADELTDPVDHILVRAPKDQYEATGPGDTVYLDWYLTSTVNQQDPLTPRQPFDGDNVGVDEAYLEQGLVIQKNVDLVLVVPSVFVIPEVGAQVNAFSPTDGEAFGYVSYIFYKDGKASIYIENSVGIWPTSGSLTLETGESVGNYNKVAPRETIDTSEDFGGYWYFNLNQPTTLVTNADQGRQLAVYNIVPNGQENSNAAGGNIWDSNNSLNTVGENSVNSYYATLTYEGIPGPNGATGIQKSNLFVVRGPKDLTDNLIPGDTVNLEFLKFRKLNPLNPTATASDDPYIDVEEAGLFYQELNKSHTLYDVWDGYIKFQLDATDRVTGRPFEPKIGQFVREVNGTGATAQVAFWQKLNNQEGIIYVKNVVGNWGIGSDGREIEWLPLPEDPDPNYRGIQRLGAIVSISIGYEPLNIGGLCVFEAEEDIFVLNIDVEEVPPTPVITGAEYLIYKETALFGLPTEPNIPSGTNLDYKQVFKLPIDPEGPSIPLNNYGYFTIYQRRNIGSLVELGSFIVPDAIDELGIGSTIKSSQTGDFYKLFIGCKGNGTTENPGRIYFVNNGIDEEGISYDWELARDKRYKGEFNTDRPYLIGDYVFYNGYFYKALTNIPGDGSEFLDVEWEIATTDSIRSIDYLGYLPNTTDAVPENYDYKGSFDRSRSYVVGEIVQNLDGNFYKALRFIPIGYNEFVDNNGILEYPEIDWEQINFTPGGDQSKKIDNINLTSFARDFDVSDNGQVLVATADYTNSAILQPNINNGQLVSIDIVNSGRNYRSAPAITVLRKGTNTHLPFSEQDTASVTATLDENGSIAAVSIDNPGADYQDMVLIVEPSEIKTKVIVYRSVNGNYQKSQEFVNSIPGMEFGKSVSVSQDGRVIAVGAPNDTTDFGNERGSVYIYKQVNGKFELSQTLQSANPVRGEKFGYNIDFDGKVLYVSALSGSSDDITLIDNNATTFDSGFTYFKNYIGNSGVIYAYENINDSLVYGQAIDYHTYTNRDNVSPVEKFGEHFVGNNNHLYVIMDDYVTQSTKPGIVLDYRRNKQDQLFNVLREVDAPVDTSKIKQCMIYDKSKNAKLFDLDYIDPYQGKIAGIADQEIDYKTSFDPATFTNGTNVANVNKENSWGNDQVGKVWWDLSNAKFLNVQQGNIVYKTNNFNTLAPGASIDVYEWVRSEITPEEWDILSGTTEGDVEGITGTTKYGSDVYSLRREYDSIAQKFTNIYYYWVKDKTSIPNNDTRKISVKNISDLIEDPKGQKYKFISLFNSNSFAIYNCEGILEDQNIVLNVQYWTNDNKNRNIHNQYEILTEGYASSFVKYDIEEKWFDSLIGYDKERRPVPDLRLPKKDRYGIFNNPRQSMFINRAEAVKQVVERVNTIFEENLITEEKNIVNLLKVDNPPSAVSNVYDIEVDNAVDLDFISVVRVETPVLHPEIINGKIVRVDIVNPGRGYQRPPTYKVEGQGSGAEFEISIDSKGSITNVLVVNEGINYNDNTTITVRKFTALVKSDESVNGRWALYDKVGTEDWQRTSSQAYNVQEFWDYIDWYAPEYSVDTEIDYIVEFSYNLQGLNDNLGDIIKVNNTGSEWLLLKKINNLNTPDYSVNYQTIGKQNGTIKLKNSLYDVSSNRLGFDAQTFDTSFFDIQPIQELRIILEAIRDDLFTDDLLVEYNKLFFASLRYVFAEQPYVDWAFKTSFVKSIHNVGELKQLPTFKNDSLESYEEYINEVKPYKASIREYISMYDKLETIQSSVSDFDNPPKFIANLDSIVSSNAKTNNDILSLGSLEIDSLNQDWLDNLSYSVVEIQVSDPGSKYVYPPKLIIDGNAEAVTSLGPNGKISSIKVTNIGSGYYSAPNIEILGTQSDGGTPARLTPILGNSPVRNFKTIVKFDRVSGNFFIETLNESEAFEATGSKTTFKLKWPMDLTTDSIEVVIDGELKLTSDYVYYNKLDSDLNNSTYFGYIEFNTPPANLSNIIINYKKNVDLLNAQDRINFYYNPTDGQYGKDLEQLMEGVDYGGVQVKSFGFGTLEGWDTDTWYEGAWDVYDETFDEESFITDGSNLTFNLSKPLVKGTKYNVYANNIRIDDEEFDGSTVDSLTNKNAVMQTLIGDGTTNSFSIEDVTLYEEFLTENDINSSSVIITIRRSTSDGSLTLDTSAYDTDITGGDLAYTTAKGINADDIVIDGDGFVTVTTSKGPEETVPGYVTDTLDITVLEKPTNGSSLIETVSYRGDGSTKRFDLRLTPFSRNNLIVRIDGNFVRDESIYAIDYKTGEVNFYHAPADQSVITLTTLGLSGTNFLEYGEFITDGSTQEFLIEIDYVENIQAYVTVNGKDVPYEIVKSDDSYELQDKVIIRFVESIVENQTVQYALFDSIPTAFSQIKVDEFYGDGSTTGFELSQAPFNQQPSAYYTLVTVNDTVLNAGYTETFTITDSLEYQLKLWQIPTGSTQAIEVEVFLNGRKLEFLQEWTYLGSGSFNEFLPDDQQKGSTVVLNPGVATAGDELKVYIINTGDYRFGYFADDVFINTSGETQDANLLPVIESGEIVAVDIIDSGVGYQQNADIFVIGNGTGAVLTAVTNEAGEIIDVIITSGGENYDNTTVLAIETVLPNAIIYFDDIYTEDDIIRVYQFSNHDYLGLERANYSVVERTKISVDTNEYFDYRQLKNSRIELQNPVTSVDYVWVVKNNKLLIPTADYILLENKRYIEIIDKLEDFDVVEVISFIDNPVGAKYGWRQFKDMSNRSQYFRLSYDNKVVLAEDLNWYDRAINIVDATNLPMPTPREPGVLFIGGERIEYLQKQGNVLKQLRRGTFGTGIKDIHLAGTEFYNHNSDSIIPYKDKEDRFTVASGKYTNMNTLYTNSDDIIFESITYDFNNNTVFPLGTQVATVIGSGFRESVVAVMQDENGNAVEMDTTYISDTEFTFITKAMPVGAYDLVIVNKEETVPLLKAQTSLVVEKILPYVQVLIPFEPEAFTDVVKNPVQTGEWFKASFDEGGIPQDYWEALDIEVFSNGRRLRKSPRTVYDQTLGQYSPVGDKQEEAEYAVNQNEGAYVRLTTPPEPETTLTIVRKTGEIWNEVGKSLATSNTTVSTFLRGKPIDLLR